MVRTEAELKEMVEAAAAVECIFWAAGSSTQSCLRLRTRHALRRVAVAQLLPCLALQVVEEIKATCVGSEIAVDVEHHHYRLHSYGMPLSQDMHWCSQQQHPVRSFHGFVCLIQAQLEASHSAAQLQCAAGIDSAEGLPD